MLVVKQSVKQLVEFACRGGDLLPGIGQGPTALEGIRAHQKLQRQLADHYQAEVPVCAVIERDEGQLQLAGRVDLLRVEPEALCLAEIKSCYGPPSRMPDEQLDLHWAQLKLYAYCHLLEHEGENFRLRMIWYDLLEERRHEDDKSFSAAQIREFGEQAVAKCLSWHQLLHTLDTDALRSAQNLEFPFASFRSGQRAMAKAVYCSLRDKGQLLCEAPTGIGKTISALFPAIKALGENQVDKVVYLTAKNSGRALAINSLATMAQRGLCLSTLQIEAKDKTCPCRNGNCEPDPQGRCPLGVGFFDRLPAARDQLIRNRAMTSQAVARAADEHQLCPFELALQMLPWAQVVICDYNYVFDPLVGLGYFKDNRDRIALLVDEAHNLVDRSRSMYSAQLNRRQSQMSSAASKTANPPLSNKLAGITRALDRYQRSLEQAETVAMETPATVDRAVNRLLELLAQESEGGLAPSSDLGDWLKELYRYRHIAELFGQHHRCISQLRLQGKYRDIDLKLRCLNATDALAESYRLFHGVVLFSATLRPQAFYREALGLPRETTLLTLPSPFPVENLGVLINHGIDTRYQQRHASIEPISQLIHSVFSARPGNYIAFFPSYQYMEQVADAFTGHFPDIPLLLQQRDSDEQQRAAFLQRFREGREQLGFAIMGGIYGEGIDYLGDALIGAIVIGVGLPAMDTEQQLIRQDFELNGLDGFDFAYRFPGLSRVLQAAGRVIRSEADRGVVVLVDRRFHHSFYSGLLPQHWQPKMCTHQQQLCQDLARFWSGDQRSSTAQS